MLVRSPNTLIMTVSVAHQLQEHDLPSQANMISLLQAIIAGFEPAGGRRTTGRSEDRYVAKRANLPAAGAWSLSGAGGEREGDARRWAGSPPGGAAVGPGLAGGGGMGGARLEKGRRRAGRRVCAEGCVLAGPQEESVLRARRAGRKTACHAQREVRAEYGEASGLGCSRG